jgi:DNA-binding MarR family transcriptional regulator
LLAADNCCESQSICAKGGQNEGNERSAALDAGDRPDAADVDLDVLENLLSFYVRAVNYGLSSDLDRRLAGLEVARGTGKIATLLLIDSHPGIRASTIAKASLRDAASISRIIGRMLTAGLVEQRVAPAERRAQELYITARGRKVARRVREIVRQQSDEFFAPLSEADRAELLRILRDLYRRMT